MAEGAAIVPLFDGAISVEHGEGWARPWRLRHEERDLYGAGLASMAACAAVRLVFRTRGCLIRVVASVGTPSGVDAPRLQQTLGPLEYDLYVDGVFFASRRGGGPTETEERHTVTFRGLPEGSKDIELWLPTCAPLDVHAVDCGGGEAPGRLLGDPRPVWLAHGSSITHGGPAAAAPSGTWPAVCARLAGLRLVNLGFGGECYLDQPVARVIRDTPCDCISLKVGINIALTLGLNVRTLRPALIGFIQTVRDGHPKTPLVVVSPVWHGPLEAKAPLNHPDFLSLARWREIMKAAVETLRASGDEHIFYRDGLELLGEHEEDLLYDKIFRGKGLHPGEEGQLLMGRRFADLEFGPAGRLLPGRRAGEPVGAPAGQKAGRKPEDLQGSWLVDHPGEKRSRMLVKMHQGVLAAFSDLPHWPPAPVHVRSDYVFLLNLPGVWGLAGGDAISFTNGSTWYRFPQVDQQR